MSSNERLSVAYRINSGADLVWVGGAWDAFARDNDAPNLVAPSVIGVPLWQFVDGFETRYLYELLFDKVRGQRSPVEVPLRCDSPGIRRYMRLRIAMGPSEGEIELVATLLRAEPREPLRLLDASAPRGHETLVICSFCKHVEDPSTGWLTIEDAVRRLGLLAGDALPCLSHGVCPECRNQVHELLSQPG